MRPWCIHFGREENAKENENLAVKIQRAAANTNISSSTWYFQKKKNIQQKKSIQVYRWKQLEKLLPLYMVYVRSHSRTLWTTTNKLEAGPAAKGRDNEERMRRSHVCFFGLVATCDVPGTCPTQKLPLFLNLIQMGPRKNKYRISEIPRPGRYRTNIK